MTQQTVGARRTGLLAALPALIFAVSAFANDPVAADKAPASEVAMDATAVRESVVATVRTLNEVYVYPETARRVGAEVMRRLDAGKYDHITTTQQFADDLGEDLSELTGDGHMSVMLAVPDEEPTHVLQEEVDRFRHNYAFQKIEILDGNIGYLKLNKFHQDEEAQVVADHALAFVSRTDALIIDLSECKGGSPELVRHMLSYFFTDQTLLWTILNRDGESTYDAFTTPGVGDARLKSDFPIFILTGPDTASGAELFTYALKSYGKATAVGQRTLGIAHFVGAVPIDERFVGRFSTYRNTNPVTKTDWEGEGIAPDVEASPERQLDVAISLATRASKTR
ncbi:S41 family peptidase [Xanthomonadaceae bacterium XH05]|nr:S41 family peptidase [Xanthomonadaceae bacterium XH05]